MDKELEKSLSALAYCFGDLQIQISRLVYELETKGILDHGFQRRARQSRLTEPGKKAVADFAKEIRVRLKFLEMYDEFGLELLEDALNWPAGFEELFRKPSEDEGTNP